MPDDVEPDRRAARVVLIDEHHQLVTIRRCKPDQAPYNSFPGGGVEKEDRDLVDTVVRELHEELGATAIIGCEVYELAGQHFFLGRLVSMDVAARSGPEFDDPTRGSYEVERVPLEQLAGCDLKPAAARDHVLRNAPTLLAALPCSPQDRGAFVEENWRRTGCRSAQSRPA